MVININKKKKSQSSLKLTDKKHPPLAIAAMFVGIFSVFLFAYICFYASGSHGNAGLYIGAWGVLCLLLSAVGFVMSWISLHLDNIRNLFPTIASIINGILLVFFVILYIVGTLI